MTVCVKAYLKLVVSKNLQTFSVSSHNLPLMNAWKCLKRHFGLKSQNWFQELIHKMCKNNLWRDLPYFFFYLQQLSGRNLYHLKYEQHDLPIPDIHCNNRSTSLTVQTYCCHPDTSICKSTFSWYGPNRIFFFFGLTVSMVFSWCFCTALPKRSLKN